MSNIKKILEENGHFFEIIPVSGIYGIHNKNTDQWYIGQSYNISKRIETHIRNLLAKVHHNDYLQRSWNKYNSNSFEFVILEVINPHNQDILNIKEQEWMKQHGYPQKDRCFNISEGGDNKPLAVETRNKISFAFAKRRENKKQKQEKEKQRYLKAIKDRNISGFVMDMR